jgi:predicted PurR-regulated permease PerM
VQTQTEAVAAFAGRWVPLGDIDLKQEMLDLLQEARGALLRGAGSAVGGIASTLGHGVIVLVAMYFFFCNGRAIQQRVGHALPLSPNQVDKLFSGAREVIQASMSGILSVAVAQAVLMGIGLWIFGVPGAVLWGSLTAFASLIPIIGCALVWMPAAIWLLTTGSWVKALLMAAWGAGIVGTVDNILRPYVMSGRVQMHPLLLLFALLGGVQAFGMLGIFAGPVILAITQSLLEMLGEEIRKDSQGSS